MDEYLIFDSVSTLCSTDIVDEYLIFDSVSTLCSTDIVDEYLIIDSVSTYQSDQDRRDQISFAKTQSLQLTVCTQRSQMIWRYCRRP